MSQRRPLTALVAVTAALAVAAPASAGAATTAPASTTTQVGATCKVPVGLLAGGGVPSWSVLYGNGFGTAFTSLGCVGTQR
jgi:hypothetical protein